MYANLFDFVLIGSERNLVGEFIKRNLVQNMKK